MAGSAAVSVSSRSSTARADVGGLDGQSAKLALLTMDLSALEKDLKKKNEQLSELRRVKDAEISSLRLKVQELSMEISTQSQKFEEKLEEQKQLNGELENEVSELRAGLKRSREILVEDRRVLGERIAVLEAKLRLTIQDRAASTTSLRGELFAAHTHATESVETAASLRATIDDLRDRLAAEQHTHAQELSSQRASFEFKIRQQAEIIAERTSHLEKANETIASHRSEREEIHQKLDDMERRYMNAEEEVEHWVEKCDELRERLDGCHTPRLAAAEQLEKHVLDLQDAVKQMRREAAATASVLDKFTDRCRTDLATRITEATVVLENQHMPLNLRVFLAIEALQDGDAVITDIAQGFIDERDTIIQNFGIDLDEVLPAERGSQPPQRRLSAAESVATTHSQTPAPPDSAPVRRRSINLATRRLSAVASSSRRSSLVEVLPLPSEETVGESEISGSHPLQMPFHGTMGEGSDGQATPSPNMSPALALPVADDATGLSSPDSESNFAYITPPVSDQDYFRTPEATSALQSVASLTLDSEKLEKESKMAPRLLVDGLPSEKVDHTPGRPGSVDTPASGSDLLVSASTQNVLPLQTDEDTPSASMLSSDTLVSTENPPAESDIAVAEADLGDSVQRSMVEATPVVGGSELAPSEEPPLPVHTEASGTSPPRDATAQSPILLDDTVVGSATTNPDCDIGRPESGTITESETTGVIDTPGKAADEISAVVNPVSSRSADEPAPNTPTDDKVSSDIPAFPAADGEGSVCTVPTVESEAFSGEPYPTLSPQPGKDDIEMESESYSPVVKEEPSEKVTPSEHKIPTQENGKKTVIEEANPVSVDKEYSKSGVGSSQAAADMSSCDQVSGVPLAGVGVSDDVSASDSASSPAASGQLAGKASGTLVETDSSVFDPPGDPPAEASHLSVADRSIPPTAEASVLHPVKAPGAPSSQLSDAPTPTAENSGIPTVENSNSPAVGESTSLIKDSTSPDIEVSNFPAVEDSSSPIKDSTSPVVEDSNSPTVPDSGSPVIDSTSPVVDDSTSPAVADSTSPAVEDSTSPAVEDST
eukprot:Rmarinus@m.6501